MSEALLIAVLALIALGAVAFPVLVGRERYSDPEELEADIQRYREALDAGTVCPRCRAPSPPGARFCQECGHALEE